MREVTFHLVTVGKNFHQFGRFLTENNYNGDHIPPCSKLHLLVIHVGRIIAD